MRKILHIFFILFLFASSTNSAFLFDLQTFLAPFLDPTIEVIGEVITLDSVKSGKNLFFYQGKRQAEADQTESKLNSMYHVLNIPADSVAKTLIPARNSIVKILNGCFKEGRVSFEQKDKASAVYSQIMANFVEKYFSEIVELVYHGDIDKTIFQQFQGSKSRVLVGVYSIKVD